MADNEISWEGRSGKEYQYWIHRIGSSFNDEPGNFIYAREIEPGAWEALCIGHTASLEVRLADAGQSDSARRSGATHLHVHTNRGGEARRAAEKADLVGRWNPVCNQGKR